MRIAVITTVRHNVGDDFVREGIHYLISSIRELNGFDLIHKHAPSTAVYGLEKVRHPRISKALDPLARIFSAKNRIDSADLVIQSGAPVYWCHPDGPHCGDSEWFRPLIQERFLRDRRGRKFLNIAGGSCQRYHSDGSELDMCPRCKNFIRDFFDVCDLTTLRDPLARSMLNRAGRDAVVLPCTSIFARDRFDLKPADGEYIVLNFMEAGGHYTFGQSIDVAQWRTQFKKIARLVQKMGRVVVACHTKDEDALARELVPQLERFLVPDEHIEYMRFYARAKFGIVNRVHAGFMMASFGKPAAVIGNDSRALMIQALDLPSYYVNDVERVGVEEIVDSVRLRSHNYEQQIEDIRDRSKVEYLSAISSALAN